MAFRILEKQQYMNLFGSMPHFSLNLLIAIWTILNKALVEERNDLITQLNSPSRKY